jgi:hypothetical protein
VSFSVTVVVVCPCELPATLPRMRLPLSLPDSPSVPFSTCVTASAWLVSVSLLVNVSLDESVSEKLPVISFPVSVELVVV